MSTYQKCDKSVSLMADEILHQFETHKPLLDAGVTVDFVFAYADVDEETGTPVGHAIMHNGYPAGGVCQRNWWQPPHSVMAFSGTLMPAALAAARALIMSS